MTHSRSGSSGGARAVGRVRREGHERHPPSSAAGRARRRPGAARRPRPVSAV